MKITIFISLIALILGSPLEAQQPTPAAATPDVNLATLFQRPNLWKSTAAALEPVLLADEFRWNSSLRDSARIARPGLNFDGQRVYECVAWFKGGLLSKVTMIFYDRGDAGEMFKDQFKALTAQTTDLITNFTRVQPDDTGRAAGSAVRANTFVWQTADSRYTLESSSSKDEYSSAFRAEFVRLTVEPPVSALAPIGSEGQSSQSHGVSQNFRGEDHVTNSMGGDVMIKDVPMVDQGQKGYCVVASAERVMRYYGADVDENDLAELANSDASKGTSPDAMVESLQNLTMRLKVRVRTILDWNQSNFLQMVSDYNQATKGGKLAPLINVSYGGDTTLADYYHQMNLPLLEKVETRKAAEFGKFQRDIQRCIDKGTPVLWSVILGLVPEKGLSPQAIGGHMRLIIGYNKDTGEIIYTDSWGLGHEQKRMAVADAWVITCGLYVIEPSVEQSL